MKKILSLFLALLMIISCLSACQTGDETTGGSGDGTTNKNDDTDNSGSDSTGTNTPPTDDLSTSQGGDSTEPSQKYVEFDFEAPRLTSVNSYINSVGGLEGDGVKGSLKDGKYYNVKAGAMFLLDKTGFFEEDAFSIEFDFSFDEFSVDGFTCLCFINEANGTSYSGASLFNYMMMTDSDGSLYHNNAQGNKFQMELGQFYNFKAIINKVGSSITIYIDGIELCTTDYTAPTMLKDRVGFRFMGGSGSGGKFWMDNLVISAVDPSTLGSSSIVGNAHYATDGAFVRDGSYSDTYYGVTKEGILQLKENPTGYRREILLKFDLTGLDAAALKHAYFFPIFQELRDEEDKAKTLEYDIYAVDPDAWDASNVTYSTMPKGEKICENVQFKWLSEVDFADAVKDALNNGQTQFSIRLVAKTVTIAEQKLWFNPGTKPYILVSTEDTGKNYVQNLVEDEQANKEIWDRADEIYDAWTETYNKLVGEGVNDVENLKTETDQTGFNSGNKTGTYAPAANLLGTSHETDYKALTPDNFSDFDSIVSAEFKNAQRDSYGGIMVESLKQEATGFFYSKEIDGRWWMIDPLGYPFIAAGMSDVHYAQLGSAAQKQAVLDAYGSYTAWAEATVDRLNELGFTNVSRPVTEVYNTGSDITYLIQGYNNSKTSISGLMSDYGKSFGLLTDGNGSTVFKNNDIMPVFDPEFEVWADDWCKGYADIADNGNIIGIMCDNELPMAYDMLDRSLGLNPSLEENIYSYAAAWTWFKNMTGKDNPGNDDITDELRELFRGFVYDRYFRIVSASVKKYAPDHMYMGCRFVTRANDAEWIMRVSSLYLDCMTINWYDALWEPDYDGIYKLEKWFGKPFIVTEFYAMGGGSLDQDGKALPNTSGAGIYTKTQEERGLFYQSYVLRLLESRNCVGWEWFQYMDNATDTGTTDLSSEGSNKGIVASYVDEATGKLKEYTELTEAMKAVNEKMYQFANYFANKNK